MKNQILLKISGMKCDGCAASVQKALSKVEGVESAEVNLGQNSATVFYESNPPSIDKLTAAVRGAGYGATAA